MKSSFRRYLPVALLLSLLIAGCAPQFARSTAQSGAREAEKVVVAPAAPAEPDSGGPTSGAADDSAHAEAYAPQADRKVILTASLQMVVKDTEGTVATIKGLVADQGGFVGSANVWREGSLLRAQLTVRVPADKMEAFLADAKKLALQVEREQSGGQDVTQEYVDLQAQLRNLEAAETELRTLMTEVRQKTGDAEQIMSVYRELTSTRGQIDQLKARIQYLDNVTTLATVTLDLSERADEPIGQPGWQPLRTLRRALNALVQTGKFAVDVLIWLVAYIVPLLIVPVGAILLIWWLTRRRRAPRA